MASTKNAFHIADGESETLHMAAYNGNKAMCIMRLNQRHTKLTTRDEDGRTRTYFFLFNVGNVIHEIWNKISNYLLQITLL